MHGDNEPQGADAWPRASKSGTPWAVSGRRESYSAATWTFAGCFNLDSTAVPLKKAALLSV